MPSKILNIVESFNENQPISYRSVDQFSYLASLVVSFDTLWTQISQLIQIFRCRLRILFQSFEM